MTSEAELVRQLRAVLGARDVDVDALVEEAWDDARSEVRAVLTRAMANDLLERVLAVVGEGGGHPSPHGSDRLAAEVGEPAETGLGDQAEDRAEGSSPGEPVVYVFGITDVAPDPTVLAGARPVPGGHPLRSVAAAGLVAIVCDVDPDVLGSMRGDTPEALDALTRTALAHDEALSAVSQRRTILPMRLGTVFADDRVTADVLRDNAEALRGELDRVAGHAEWAVTVRHVADARTSNDADGARKPSEHPAAETGGRDYLERRRAELDAREARRQVRRGVGTLIHERLGAHATEVGTTERPVGASGEVASLRGVYLVATPRLDGFLAEVDAVRAAHPDVVVEVSGPLPPYHFVAPAGALGGTVAP